ncbi:MAG: hypothetical protein GC156_14640 [Actinomycetales bacterium]|nr:hypothetical protein [Actinomycetales bacterium]
MAVASDLGGTPSGVPPVLVLVTPDCPACARVPEIVEGVRRRLPDARVTVLDVSAQDVPDGVPFVGTPTYIVEDRIVSLGNPDPDDLALLIEGWRNRDG